MAPSPEVGWDLYRSLLEVVNHGSFSAAARAIGLTQPTLGRHIDDLEARLGVSLFRRSNAGLQPTSAALALLPHAEAMARSAEALARAATSGAASEHGVVRITTAETVGEVMIPMLAPFSLRHPGITLEVSLSSRAEDVLRGDADIAIRLFKPTQRALVARRLGVFTLGLHAARAYVEARGAPRSARELPGHPLIGFDSSAIVRRMQQHGIAITRDQLRFRCDSYASQYAAIRAGLGIGLCPIQRGRQVDLVRVLPRLAARRDLWIVMHEDMRTSRRVRLLFDFLVTELGRWAAT